jgi:hypothetical protein
MHKCYEYGFKVRLLSCPLNIPFIYLLVCSARDLNIPFLKYCIKHQWLTPVIPATQEAEIRRIMFGASPGK